MNALVRHLLNLHLLLVCLLSVAVLWLINQQEIGREFEIAGLVFTVAGAIVALILPAAELGGQYVTSRLEEYTDRITHSKKEDHRDELNEAVQFINEALRKAKPAWKGSMYAFLSMVLAMASIVVPHVGRAASLSKVFLSFAVGFLLVGSSLFLPFAYLIYTFRTATDLRDRFLKILKPNLPADVRQTNEFIQEALAKTKNRTVDEIHKQ